MTTINDFISKIGQGTKPNMFAIDIVWPGSGLADGVPGTGSGSDKDLIDILCKSAALPASNLGVIEVPFRGRTVKIAGDRTFDTWTATFFNDKDMKVRSYFEQWLEAMNTHNGNNSPLFKPSQSEGYMAEVRVKQLEKNNTAKGSILREYTLMHAFPTNVSQIDLGYDSNDQIAEFSVEFQYSYWKVVSPTATNLTDAAASGVAGVTKTIEL
ncbi:MAG TPA: phage tail protein [Prochlorococcaceae cyanobacterium AMR_MDS_5431]|nr:phage tail protein [Prochlorococcaceae cyanobacterium AMR_MDS_5431]